MGLLTKMVVKMSETSDTAKQTSHFSSKYVAYENINERIDGGVGRNDSDRSDVCDISVVVRGTEIVQPVNGQVWHPT